VSDSVGDYIGRILMAIIVGTAIIAGAVRISDAIREQQVTVTEEVRVLAVQSDGWVIDTIGIYRPDGTVCYAFQDTLEADNLFIQFEEWGENLD